MDKKAVERFVLRHRDDYMVKIIEEIRSLKWIVTSPYLRCKKPEYGVCKVVFYPSKLSLSRRMQVRMTTCVCITTPLKQNKRVPME